MAEQLTPTPGALDPGSGIPAAPAGLDLFHPMVDPFTPQADLVGDGCPVSRLADGSVLIAGMPAVERALKDDVALSSRPPDRGEPDRAQAINRLDGEEHARVRRIINRTFTPRAVAPLAPHIADLANTLVDAFADQRRVDLVEAFTGPLPAQVGCELLGIPVADRPQFLRWADDAIANSYADRRPPSDADFVAYVAERIEDRRRDPGDDLISRLATAEDQDQRLADDELVSLIRLLIIAGTETTANLLATLLHQLLADRSRWESVRADRELVPVAVEEALRIDPPLNWLPRIVAEPVEMAGCRLEPGTRVLVGLGSANRDPSAYPDPDSFRLDRPQPLPTPHMTFGYGSHFCVGAALARLEGTVGLGVLLDRLPALRLAPEFRFAPRGPLMMRGCASLPVEF